ncbi:cold-inducible protein YdjO-related protein [Alicyclobacillus acidoterrestris]|uniref:cold-inducible protein YdjO-related protein n=2 Tax=Alicyclobacillus acidoterrestris TaxID=1450 RepID=UPI0009DC2C81
MILHGLFDSGRGLLMNFNNRRKPASEYVYDDIVIWQCSDCDCWSRNEFVHGDEPLCPMCKGKMSQQVKNIRVE